MMKLAINYSPQATELLAEGTIDIDLFKCADWPEIVEPARKVKPIYVHFPVRAGDPQYANDFARVQDWKMRTQTTYVNMHLSAPESSYPGIPFDARDGQHIARITANMITQVREATALFGAQKVIVENLPTQQLTEDPGDARELIIAVLPQTIAAVIRETQCNLLFDIDHARVSAETLGISLQDYVAELPMERLRELHMTGTHRLPDGRRQSHLPMMEDDWEVFEWALQQIAAKKWSQPDIFAFEYGGIGPKFDWRTDKAVIAEQVPRLRKMMDEVLQ